MPKRKLKRFAELKTFPNVFEEPRHLKGLWRKEFFQNSNLITVELACGKGEYTIELARRFPYRNFIGVDLKGARLWRGAKTALEHKLNNVAFVRIYIEHLTEYFAPGEIDEIWITFPDPYPKLSKAKKRLTSPRFLNLYRQITTPESLIHMKTDDQNLFDFTLETLRQEKARVHQTIPDLRHNTTADPILLIPTAYEQKYRVIGRTIKYVSFSL